MKKSYLIIFVIVLFGKFVCGDEIMEIKSPYENSKCDVGIKIMELIYPSGSEIIYNEPIDSLKFQIPSNELLESFDSNLQQIILFNLNNLENNKIYSFVEFNELSYFKSSDFLYLDIDNDKIPEVFSKAEAPWGGGGEYSTIFWKKDKSFYKVENVFWGTIERIIKTNNNSTSLITKYKGFPSFIIYEIKLPSFSASKSIFYSKALSIPNDIQFMQFKNFTTINQNTSLRVWPENINSGYFCEIIQNRSNGNVQAILQDLCLGSAYGQFVDSENKKWFLVVMSTYIKPKWHTFGELKGNVKFLVGWIDEESIKFVE